MPDPNSIFLLYSLRAALDSLNSNPELDKRYAGVKELKSAIQEELRELELEVKMAIEQMPEPSVGVPA